MSKVRTDSDQPLIRIGELARRAGVPSATLRAWERRYDVIRPVRGESGYRLYSPEDERRLRSMVALVESGRGSRRGRRADPRRRRLAAAFTGRARRLRSRSPRCGASCWRRCSASTTPGRSGSSTGRSAMLSVEAFVGELVLPVLRVGSANAGPTARSRSARSTSRATCCAAACSAWLAAGAGETGPSALLACPPGEYHDLGLIGFGLVLRERGWRITFLGSDTPIDRSWTAPRRWSRMSSSPSRCAGSCSRRSRAICSSSPPDRGCCSPGLRPTRTSRRGSAPSA